VTVLPAVLAKLGNRVDRGLLAVTAAGLARLGRLVRWEPSLFARLKQRRTLLQRLKGGRQESRLWALVLRPAMRFPALSAIVSAAMLLVLAHAPLVFAFVLGLAFLLLLLTFRSIMIPIKAIILNLLSVGAAYGVLVWIFQQGHLEGLLGFHSNGAVVTWLPLFLFAVLFGLSMDYHVFILSRIKELVDRGVPTDVAVERGIRRTASTVTSAAVVMIAVFGIFASLSTLDMKQLGVGLAVAVLIDATIIRGVLLPATMKLLGRWNWYLPTWLEWLPRLNVEPELHEPSQMPPPALPRPAYATAGAAEASTPSSARRSPRPPAATLQILEQE
jgi:uncharacterized membrane protein YdfJ with MMPL/SSD domain